jgi:hypothetical protein
MSRSSLMDTSSWLRVRATPATTLGAAGKRNSPSPPAPLLKRARGDIVGPRISVAPLTSVAPLIFVAVAAFCVLCADRAVAAGQTQKVEESFARDAYDKNLWAVERIGAKVDPTRAQLKIEIPKGPAGRPPLGLRARFRIEGDFDIRAGYAINAWPMPKKEWINLEVYIESADGPAAVIRTNHAKEGSGYTLWHEPADKKNSGAWKQIATKDIKGTLRLKRSGERLQFFVGGPAGDALRELGTISYGTSPVSALMFRVVVPETLTPVDVAFGKIEIEAERLIGPPGPAKWMFGRRAWMGAGAAVAGTLVIAVWLGLRSRRSKRGMPLSGKDGS